jgi:PAS fold
MIHPEDRPLIQVAREAGFNNLTDNAFQIEFRVRHADNGAERWMLSPGQVIERSSHGQPLPLLGIHVDTADHRNEPQALREREALLRLASDAAGVYAWTWDLATDGEIWADGPERGEATSAPRLIQAGSYSLEDESHCVSDRSSPA